MTDVSSTISQNGSQDLKYITFTKAVNKWSSSSDIKKLRKALNFWLAKQNKLKLLSVGPWSQRITEVVSDFQLVSGISPVFGEVGPKTRKALNDLKALE